MVEIHQLNDDAVVEILVRLPTATVLRARAVCKAWQRMTSSAEFMAAHARRRQPELIFQRGSAISGALVTIPLATLDEADLTCLRHVQYPAYTADDSGAGRRRRDWSGYMLIASCDGLLLFQRDSDHKDFAVCNPVTRQWSMVPRVPGGADSTYSVTGFYVHAPSGEHRILCLAADDQGGSHYVCSLESDPHADAWRRLGQAWPWPLSGLRADQPVRYVSHGGKLHWSEHPPIRFSTDPWPPCAEERYYLPILAFDTVLETFRRIRRPPRDGDWSFLLEMDGMLAIGHFHMFSFIDIWVLQDYNDDQSWTVRLRVHLPQQLMGSCWAINTCCVGRTVILLGNYMRTWVALYDVAEKKVLKRTQLGTSINGITPLNVLLFKDTLERHPSIFTTSSSATRKRKLHTIAD